MRLMHFQPHASGAEEEGSSRYTLGTLSGRGDSEGAWAHRVRLVAITPCRQPDAIR